MKTENEFYWLNPNISPCEGHELFPLLTLRFPQGAISEDEYWLVLHSNKGLVIVDLYNQVSVVTPVEDVEKLSQWCHDEWDTLMDMFEKALENQK